MSDKLYDILNKIERWLPALGVFYLTIANVWNLPWGDQVNQTIVAIATLIAATLEIATAVYKKQIAQGDTPSIEENTESSVEE